jgi:hypothetical protein
MTNKATVIGIAILIAGIAIAAALVIGSRQDRRTARIRPLREADRAEAFIARFDSLTDARLHPLAWHSGTFLKTGFDENREHWTLTVSSRDWNHRDRSSKQDLGAILLAAFQAVRAQAGGDPDRAVLTIEDQDGEVTLRASQATGVVVER